MKWKEYFNMMADWKCLPAYKVEPRIDSLVGFYLEKAVSDFLNVSIVGIIPELPIRLATVKPYLEDKNYKDRSYKVDFFVIDSNGKNYLIEFKTDSSSRRDEQDSYLDEAKSVGMRKVVEGIVQISNVSTYKTKYSHLLNKLKSLGLLDDAQNFIGKTVEIEIVYFQPSRGTESKKCIDFLWFSEWLQKQYSGQEFEEEFSIALKKWAKD